MTIRDVVFVYQMKSREELQWHGRYHRHEPQEYEVHYFIQGNGNFLNGDTNYSIKPGSLFITSPAVYHSIIANDLDHPVSYYALLFYADPPEEARELLLSHIDTGRVYNIGTNYRFFFEELKEKGMSDHILLKKSAEYQFLSFLYQLSDGLQQFNYGSKSNHHIEKALRILQNSVMGNLTLGDLSEKLELTESYLVRLFKQKMSMTPMRYYRKLKIEAASSMLINTEQPVYTISQKLQFYSEFHFSKCFKQFTGLSPSEYRKNYFQIIGQIIGQ